MTTLTRYPKFKPKKVLDAFCGAGGASYGYYLAGCDVLGVDIKAQKHYPFSMAQTDALDYLKNHMAWIRDNFYFIHSSPPCQHYSTLKALHKDIDYPDLVSKTRDLLDQIGLPYAIENVQGAPLQHPLMLCGTMFGLRLFRHRYFELGQDGQAIRIPAIPHSPHAQQGLHAPKTSREPDYSKGEVHSIYGHFSGVEQARQAMQIGWMTRNELAQAIPPAYTKYIMDCLQHTL